MTAGSQDPRNQSGLRIWLVSIGEQLPVDGPDARLFRIGLLAGELAARGHQLVWWTSTFDHAGKRQRYPEDRTVELENGVTMHLLHAPGYKRTISPARLLNHRLLASKFRRRASAVTGPDIVLACMPTIELARVSVELALAGGYPSVVDIRDLWPDTIVELTPEWTRSWVRTLLRPFYRELEVACAGATAIFGITPAFVDWGLRRAYRSRTELDGDFPHGYSPRTPSDAKAAESRERWMDRGVVEDEGRFIVCLFGQMSRHLALADVIDAARLLEEQGAGFQFVFCGNGRELEGFRKRATGLESVLFPGWVEATDIWVLMRMSKCGLAPYVRTADFQASIPNKAIEYFSAGLPLVTTLDGLLGQLVTEEECGSVYREGEPAHLAELLRRLAEDRKQLARMSNNASSLFQRRFSSERVYGAMANRLEEIARTEMSRRGAS